MYNSSIIAKDNIVRFSGILSILLPAQIIISTFQIYIPKLLMIPYVSQVLPVYIERILIVRVYLAQHAPVHVDLKGGLRRFFTEIIENIQIWHDCGQVGPEFHLNIAYLLHCTVHFRKKTFKFNDIGKLRVHMLMVNVILLNKFFYNVFVSKDGELLLDRRFLFLSYIQFYNGCMNILHHFILIKGECDVYTGAIDELIE
jgi:hypothetical protein